MKKTLAALAVLGAFSGAALAQSSVTLYGIADGGLQVVDSGINSVNTLTGIESGQQSGSRFGLKGSEQLGNGLKAVFNLENGFNLDDGKQGQGNRLFGRQAWVGVEGGFGTVAIGRLASLSSGTGAFDMFGAADPFSTGFKDAGLQSTFALTSFRTDNSVVYQSSKLAGFQLGAMYSVNTDGAEKAGTSNNTQYFNLAANYTIGKLWTALTYEQLEFSKTATFTREDTKLIKFAANYDFGMVKPYFAYANGKDVRTLVGLDFDATAPKAAGSTETVPVFNTKYGFNTDSFMVGATAPIMGGTLMASYQYLDGEMSNDSNVKAKLDVFAVGYDYPMSKRTNLYGVVSYTSGDDSLNKDNYGKIGATNDAKKAWNTSLEAANRTVYQVGVRHKF